MSLGVRVLGAAGLLGVLAAVCGCGSSKGGGNGAGCAALGADCDRIEACAPGYLAIVGWPDVATCKSYYVAQCNEELAAPHTGLTPSLAQQCGDAIAATSCSAFLSATPVSPACIPHGGTVQNGGSCTTPWQCASGICSVGNINQCGTCVAAVAAGQACATGLLGSSCGGGLNCALTPASPTATVCTGAVAMGGACADSAVCPANDSCDPTTQVCTKLPAVGQACDPNAVIYCDPTQAGALCDSNTSTCQPVSTTDGGCSGTADGGSSTCTTILAVGAPCTSYDFCTIGTTCTGGVCTICDGTPVASVAPAATDRRPALRPRRAPAGWAPRAPAR